MRERSLRICLCVLTACIARTAAAGTIARMRAEAVASLNAGDAAAAARILDRALAEDPADVELLELLGLAHLRAGAHREAETAWTRLLGAFPERARARLWLAQHLEKQGRSEEARRHYVKLDDTEPEPDDEIRALATLGLARIDLRASAFDDARVRAAPLLPRPEAALLVLQAIEGGHGLDEAVVFAERYVDAIPRGRERLGGLLHRKAVERFHAGADDDALVLLRRAVSLTPSLGVRRDLAHILERSGSASEAVAIWREVLEHDADDASALGRLCRLLVAHLAREEPRVKAQLLLSRMHLWRGEYARSLAALREAEALGAPAQDILNIRARALWWRGDHVGAAADFRQVIELDPGDMRAWESLDKVELPLRPEVSGRVYSFTDSDDRLVLRESLRGAVNVLPRLRLHADVGHVYYDAPGVDWSGGVSAEAGATVFLEGPLELHGALGGEWFAPGDGVMRYGASAVWRGWDRLRMEIGARGGPVETPLAVVERIRVNTQRAEAVWSPTGTDMLRLGYGHHRYSDDNLRHTVHAEYSRRVCEGPAVRVGINGLLDTSDVNPPAYYAPRRLFLGRAFVEGGVWIHECVHAMARLGAGYGWDRSAERPVGDMVLRLRWRPVERLEIAGGVRHFRNPSYYGLIGFLDLQVRF